jgi:hypothetical protein
MLRQVRSEYFTIDDGIAEIKLEFIFVNMIITCSIGGRETLKAKSIHSLKNGQQNDMLPADFMPKLLASLHDNECRETTPQAGQPHS